VSRITENIAKRLKQGLDTDRRAWEAEQARKEAAVQAEAEKQERDRIAVAKAEEEAEQRRKNREDADRLARWMRRGDIPDAGDTAAERREWAERCQVSPKALALAASDGTPADLAFTSDFLVYVGSDGRLYNAGNRYVAAVRALHYWSNDLLTRAERVAEAARRNQRQAALDKLADQAVAAWEQNKQVEDSLENG